MNLEAMRKRLAELNAPKGEAANVMFKPTEGETIIRILPDKQNPDNPFSELLFHYGLGGKTYFSPLSYGERDPIAEFSDALVAEGGLSKDEYKQAKKFYPTKRTYCKIVVRGKESEGVKFWAFGKTTFADILGIINDPDYGDITDPEKGHDIKLTFTPKEKSSTGFAETKIMARPKPSALSNDNKILKLLLEDQPVLLDSFKKHTYDELKDVLAKYLAPKEEPTAAASPAVPAGEVSPAAESAKAAATKLNPSVEDEFSEIFNS